MDRSSKRAAWVVFGSGIALLLVVMAYQVYSGIDFLTMTLTTIGPIIAGGLYMIYHVYKIPKSDQQKDDDDAVV